MNEKAQNEYLINLLKVLFQELGVYLAFADTLRLMVGEQEIDKILSDCRSDPIALKTQVESYVQEMLETLPDTGDTTQDWIQLFLRQWKPTGDPN